MQRPVLLLIARLAALVAGEVREMELFSSPSRRSEDFYRKRGKELKCSVVSQFAPGARAVFMDGRPLMTGTGLTAFGKCCANFEAALTPKGGALAAFVWREDIYRSRRDDDLIAPQQLLQVMKKLVSAKKPFGILTSWGLLMRGVPPRPESANGHVFPFGATLRFGKTRSGHTPSVRVDVARRLATFFADEPITQAYSEDTWLITGPGRLFAVVPCAGDLGKSPWLHHEGEKGREEALRQQHLDLLARKNAADAENRARSKSGKLAARKRKTRGENDPSRMLKPMSLHKLYDTLERLLTLEADEASHDA